MLQVVVVHVSVVIAEDRVQLLVQLLLDLWVAADQMKEPIHCRRGGVVALQDNSARLYTTYHFLRIELMMAGFFLNYVERTGEKKTAD